jgi:hypothetical protein
MNSRWLGYSPAQHVERIPPVQTLYFVYAPRAIKEFERVAGAADHKVCFLVENGGLYKDENAVAILVETLDEIGKAILKSRRTQWEGFVRSLKFRKWR